MLSYTWEQLKQQSCIKLYAGELLPDLPQFRTHIGLNPTPCSPRCIIHDVCYSMPLQDNTVEVYQAEDVFEHVQYEILPAIFDEIFRVLQPGGLFRLSLPDYRCDVLRERSVFDGHGRIVYDPLGGGALRGMAVIDGGHLWFPVLENVIALFERSKFNAGSSITILHGYLQSGKGILDPIDYSLGHVQRTPDHDERVQHPPRPMSLVVDAVKSKQTT